MADKRKATDDDIPGARQPRPRAARTETTAGDDTAATSAQDAAGPGTSQAPAGLTAATTPGFLFGGALGRGGGSGHGGFSPPHSGGAGGSATGYGSVSGGQNQVARPWQTGTGQPHGDSSGQPPSAAPEQQSSSRARAPSPVSSYAGAPRGEQQYRAGLEALDAGLLAADRILDRPISISPRAPGCNFCRALASPPVPFCQASLSREFFGNAPPQHAQIGSAPPSPLPASEQEFRADLEALDAELLAVTRTLKNLKVGSGPICKACDHLSGSNNACSVCRQGGPPPPPPGLG